MDEEEKIELPAVEKSHQTYTRVKPSDTNVVIFDPRGVSDYLRTYPELRQIEEFVNVGVNDLKFIWWYANPTSPLVQTQNNPAKRAATSCLKVWGKDYLRGEERKKTEAYCRLNFPEPIRLAIERMVKMDYDARYRAKLMADKTFSDCEDICNLSFEDFKDSNGVTDYTKFLTVKRMAVNMMPELLKVKEQGFAVLEKGKKENEDTQQTMEEFLDEQ